MFLALLTVLSIGFGHAAETKFVDPNFDRAVEREKMLEFAKYHPDTYLAVTANIDKTKEPVKAEFVETFWKKIWPTISALKKQENLYELWMVALDRALFNDSAEEAQWKSWKTEAKNAVDSILSDTTWSETVSNWAKLAETLKGPLAEYALDLKKQMEVESYPPEALPHLKRLNEVMTELDAIKNKSPLAKGLQENIKKTNDLVKDYYSGKISFDQAWKGIEDLKDSSRDAVSQDIAHTGKDYLNEAAILRTKIAKIKGYSNWAELVLARQAKHYAQGARTPSERIAFLNGILESTKAPYLEYLKKTVSVINTENGPLKVEDLRPSQLALLGPESNTIIRDYFPLENIEKVWKKTMRESGASERVLENITLDGYPREGKQGHAYMANLSSHKPVSLVLDSATLEIKARRPGPKGWHAGRIFIVQNYREDGPQFYSTAFHEGGHALDYSHRLNIFPTPEEVESSNSYSETHSMTMERFLDDVEFLVANGKTRDGKKLPRALAEKFVLNSRISALSDLRSRAGMARYDIELWNYDYETGGKTFLEKAHELRTRVATDMFQVKYPIVKGIDVGYSAFATPHFMGGQVRYIGYVYADMGAQMTADHLWDHFEKTTGRRSLYKQKTLVPTLRDAYYQKGFSQEYPKPVEAFTGKTFSPEAIVKPIVETVKNYIPEPVKRVCEEQLTAAKPNKPKP